MSPRETEILARITGGQKHQADVVRNEHHGRYCSHVRAECAAELGAHSRLQLAALAARDSLLAEQTANLTVVRWHRSSLSGVVVAAHAGVPFGAGDG